jgi:hypothetical protein
MRQQKAQISCPHYNPSWRLLSDFSHQRCRCHFAAIENFGITLFPQLTHDKSTRLLRPFLGMSEVVVIIFHHWEVMLVWFHSTGRKVGCPVQDAVSSQIHLVYLHSTNIWWAYHCLPTEGTCVVVRPTSLHQPVIRPNAVVSKQPGKKLALWRRPSFPDRINCRCFLHPRNCPL